jgi:hypothetical protein
MRPPDEDEEPADLTKVRSHKERVGKYFMWHLRRQMSIGVFNHFLGSVLVFTSIHPPSRYMVACLGCISRFCDRAEEPTR